MQNLDLSIGKATFLVKSFLVLLIWIPLKEKPGIGTILNAILIAATIEIMLPILPTPQIFAMQILQVLTGIILVAIGSGLYLTANLGPGPRDGTMTGLTKSDWNSYRKSSKRHRNFCYSDWLDFRWKIRYRYYSICDSYWPVCCNLSEFGWKARQAKR